MPATPPVRNATSRAFGIDPDFAAAAVRTLPRVARFMPMKPVRPDMNAPRTNASVRARPEPMKLRASELSGFFDRDRGHEDHDGEGHEDHQDGLELAA